jgi:hypothetical protein
MELELLGPLVPLAPGESVSHEEYWSLYDGVDIGTTDESLAAALRGPLSATGGTQS